MSSLRPSSAGGVVGRLSAIVGIAVLAGVLAAGLALPFIGGLGLSLKSASDNFEALPGDLAQPPLPQRTVMTYADGTPMATFYESSSTLGNIGNRVVVPISQIAQPMQQSIVAIEDSRYYQHGAIDLRGTLRALLTNAGQGTTAEGGSTLTQEYVKNLLELEGGDNAAAVAAASQKSLTRKVRELKYAVDLAKTESKQQILGDYLNLVYFGNGAYGAEAAAERYFSTTAANLTLPQAAMLAGIVQSPAMYDPIGGGSQGMAATVQRRNEVLQAMVNNNMINQQQATQAAAGGIGLNTSFPSNGCSYAGSAAFYCNYVQDTILNDPSYGATAQDRQSFWNQGGLTVTTTLSRTDQNAAQTAASDRVYASDPVASAVDMVEPGTGKVLAMAQTIPYGAAKDQTSINLSVDTDMGGGSGFQTGSTFKSFVAAAAVQQGTNPYTDVINSPYSINLPLNSFTNCSGQYSGSGTYPVTNQSTAENGKYTIQTALEASVNTFFVQLEQQQGICPGYNLAVALGVHQATGQPLQQVPSMTLGVNEIAPLTMAQAYATFAARGVHCNPIVLNGVVNKSLNKSYAVPQANCTPVMSATTADTMNDLLKGVVGEGTGAVDQLAGGRVAAGKTGTANDTMAAWFVGYTPQIATAVWMGGAYGNVVMHNITIGGQYYSEVFGNSGPGPIWQTAMDTALAGQPAEAFVPPPPHATLAPTPSPTPAKSGAAGTATVPAGTITLPGTTTVITLPPVLGVGGHGGKRGG